MQNSEFRRPLRGRNKNAETINTGTQFEITSHGVGHNNSEFLIPNSEFYILVRGYTADEFSKGDNL